MLDLLPCWRLSLAALELPVERGEGGLGWGHACGSQVLLLKEAVPGYQLVTETEKLASQGSCQR